MMEIGNSEWARRPEKKLRHVSWEASISDKEGPYRFRYDKRYKTLKSESITSSFPPNLSAIPIDTLKTSGAGVINDRKHSNRHHRSRKNKKCGNSTSSSSSSTARHADIKTAEDAQRLKRLQSCFLSIEILLCTCDTPWDEDSYFDFLDYISELSACEKMEWSDMFMQDAYWNDPEEAYWAEQGSILISRTETTDNVCWQSQHCDNEEDQDIASLVYLNDDFDDCCDEDDCEFQP